MVLRTELVKHMIQVVNEESLTKKTLRKDFRLPDMEVRKYKVRKLIKGHFVFGNFSRK